VSNVQRTVVKENRQPRLLDPCDSAVRVQLMPELDLTPTEQRIFDLLLDMRWHSRTELVDCLPNADEHTDTRNVYNHVTALKRKLRDTDYRVLREESDYRLVRITSHL
jgi:DNA-binding response OmpR family regulator